MTPIPLAHIKERFPKEGLFKDKSWLLSPEPLVLESKVVDDLKQLGELLAGFSVAANRMYFDYREDPASLPVCAVLDAGKPAHIIDLALAPSYRDQVPRLIRPDIMLTHDGLKITEIDSLPGGIGLTAWLNQLYSESGWPVIGGNRGMIDGFEQVLDGGKVYISREAQDYRPEMAWILGEMESTQGSLEDRLVDTWKFDPAIHKAATAYRYFELWDLDNVEHIDTFTRYAASGETVFTPPMKAFLEEKLWLALLWNPGLQNQWRERLGKTASGGDAFERMKDFVPKGWILDPVPIPHFAEYPGLGIQNWDELKHFSQRDRHLVAKISGFSQNAWGSRGVHIGHDLPAHEWQHVIDDALKNFSSAPHILQVFHQSRLLHHPFYDRDTDELRTMNGRARLCPYYFIKGKSVELGGVLATICPEDKKILHGMTDAILVPCVASA